MKRREDVIARIEEKKIIVVLRGLSETQLLPAVQALFEGGISLVELPLDPTHRIPHEKTLRQIRLLREAFADRVTVGVGTVLTEDEVERAAEAGAEFVLSPDVCEGVIRRTREKGLVSIPGALTPTEVMAAHRFGADFVKLFPDFEGRIPYLKALTVPLAHVKILVMGSVTPETLTAYLKAGAVGVGVATAIADRQVIREENWAELRRRAWRFTSLL